MASPRTRSTRCRTGFRVETIAAIALGMVHLSRLAEEITWWSNPRFGFIRVADAFSTGRSMMPNKKNPDPAELVRGRAARVIGELTGVLTLLEGLPLAYQRDLQERRRATVRRGRGLRGVARRARGIVETLPVDPEGIRRPRPRATRPRRRVADAIVRRSLPFRCPPPHRRLSSWPGPRRPGSGSTRCRTG